MPMKLHTTCLALVASVFLAFSIAEAAPRKEVRKAVRQKVKAGNIFKSVPSNKRAVKTKNTNSATLPVYSMTGSYAATSGTPPTLVSIAEIGIKNLFWSNGVIDGIVSNGVPNEGQCSQFFGAAGDGQSAGYPACNLAQNVAQTFEIITQGETSICLMRAVTKAQSGVSVGSGASLTEALTPNSDTSTKLVKVVFAGFPGGGGPGQPGIFFEISGEETNKGNGNLYEQKMYFCQGTANPLGREHWVIKRDLTYTSSQLFDQPGVISFESSISSKLNLDSDGKIIFDPFDDKVLNAALVGDGIGCDYNKVEMVFENKKIYQKVLDNCFGSPQPSYSVIRYSGTSMNNLRFIEGGAKDAFVQTITEFRDDRYVAAPNNEEFSQDLAPITFSEDFYNQAPVIDTSDVENFDCNRIDIDETITVDLTNPALIGKVMTCQGAVYSDLDFCRSDDDVNTAAIASLGSCSL
jgi:hypothetical protein